MTVNGRSVEVYGPHNGEVLLRFVPLRATLPIVVHCPPDTVPLFLKNMDRYAFGEEGSAAALSRSYSFSAAADADLATTGELSLAIIEDPRNYDFSPDTPFLPQRVPLNATGPQIGVVGPTGTVRPPLPGAGITVALPAPRYPTMIRAL
ncbi:hypothetical protein STCU_10571 [Strigomonas culicis]|uniref:Uncharacterized protein n=1 Tax=Strigomonas culicis TaxID=28005 RepID=S9USI2_9TRYP|nr:hypothetical protein STCU_10571 [Strigomonas culicis]|eukprot:EPY17516.1 hypothetical protein STCU_10571 [Strigomonas culicis]